MCQEPPTPRRSLDARFAKSPVSRPSAQFDRPPPTEEETFEDIGLDGDSKPKEELRQQPAKKKGIFARFGDQTAESQSPTDAPRPTSSHRGFHLPGRKRGQSGQGAELGTIEQSGVKESGEANSK